MAVDFADETRAKNWAGNPATTEVPAVQVTQCCEAGEDLVRQLTGKQTWASSDVGYVLAQTAAELFASFFMRTTVANARDKDNLSLTHFSKAERICEILAAGTADEGFVVEATNYRTQNINPDAEIYRSTQGNDEDDIADISTS